MKLHRYPAPIFIKRHELSMDADWERVNRFHQATTRTPGVVAPEPLEKRTISRQIVYSRVNCSRPILKAAKDSLGTFEQFGSRLFELHANTSPSNLNIDSAFEILSRFGLTTNDALSLAKSFPFGICHGDCWHGNIFISDDNEFIVLDPLPASLMTDWMPEKAPGCIDLAYFCASLFLRQSIIKAPLIDTTKLNRLANLTIQGYIANIESAKVAQPLNALCIQICTLWIEQIRIRLSFPINKLKVAALNHLHKRAFFNAN